MVVIGCCRIAVLLLLLMMVVMMVVMVLVVLIVLTKINNFSHLRLALALSALRVHLA